MRIAVTGKQGQVVSSLLERAPQAGVEIIAVGRPELDLVNYSSIRAAILAIKPDVIVSAAAYTSVDAAEKEVELAFAINADGPAAIAQVAAELDIPVVHLSTDYVYPGDKMEMYIEADTTGPMSVYGKSKLAGERGVTAANGNHAILRTAWVYSPFGANFVKTMLRLAETRDTLNVVGDQYGMPTSAFDIADAVITISKRLIADADPELRGVFHMTGSGEASWADLAEAIFTRLQEKSGKTVSVERIATAAYPTPARRPVNSRLSNAKLKDVYGIVLPDWRVSLRMVLDRLL